MTSEAGREHVTHYGATVEQEREVLKEAQIAAIANPASLGLAAFALPLFLWGAINADFFDRTRLLAFLIPLGLVYGGATQYVAGMWAFRKHEHLLATLFSSFGAFWISYAGLLWMQQARFIDLSGVDGNRLYGLFFIGWAIFAAYMTVASFRANFALGLTLLALTLTFLAVAIGFYDGSGWMRLGGWLAMITGVLCWYDSAADAINTVFGRIMLPTRTLRWGTPLEPEYRRPELA